MEGLRSATPGLLTDASKLVLHSPRRIMAGENRHSVFAFAQAFFVDAATISVTA
jgi:hypothetical protein